jgi:hypothetical protein
MSQDLQSQLSFHAVGLVLLAVSIGRFVVRAVLRVRVPGDGGHW